MNGLMAGLYSVSEWVMRFWAVNTLWVLFNLPVLFFALNLYFVKNISEVITLIIIIVIIAPFVFFPATTSLFAVIRQWIVGVEISVFRSYLTYYKENYVRSMVGGLFIILIFFIFLVDYYFIAYYSKALSYFFLIVAFYLAIYTLYFFCQIVHFHTTIHSALKNALLMVFIKPLYTLRIGLSCGLFVFVSINFLPFLIPTLLGALVAYISLVVFFKVMKTLDGEN